MMKQRKGLPNHFCHELHEGCLPHDKNDSDKTVHNLQLTSPRIRS